MCGIVGLSNSSLSSDALLLHARKMTQALNNRGPDDNGLWSCSKTSLAFGHVRLSIVDLSPLGHQPMTSRTGRYVMVFNGEVYNFQSLKEELTAFGHTFRGGSDTEVILAAFEEWGIERSLPRFNGMFVCAIWDEKEQTLTLLRDRLGVKPLYYGWNSQGFYFASEMRAIEVLPFVERSIDTDSLALFMQYNYIPAPWSIYKNFFKLVPGTLLTISSHELLHRPSSFSPHPEEPATLRPKRFWSLKDVASCAVVSLKEQPLKSEEELDEMLNEYHALLRDSIRLRMVADVPLGAFLSGGIDSSLVVSVMQELSSSKIKTFTIGMTEEAFDEAPFARKVAQHLGTDHTEHIITSEEALDIIPLLPALFDEPFGDSSQIPTYLVSKLARQKVTVSLSGDGGDEFFAGYTHRYLYTLKTARQLKLIPKFIKAPLSRFTDSWSEDEWGAVCNPLFSLLPDSKKISHPGRKIKKLSKILQADDEDILFQEQQKQWDPEEVLVSGSPHRTLLSDSSLGLSTASFLERMMFVDQNTYLPDDIMVKVDRCSMGVSLEAREPLLDYRLLEYAWKMPMSLKLEGSQAKIALRRILSRYIPPALVNRKKRGFEIPISEWLRGPLREWASELLNEQRLREGGFINAERVTKKWEEHLAGTHEWHILLWNVLMFQAWLKSRKT
jgi:asparagine synthase (glutamine-hydrolysing)